jgi:hypothetical protein
LLWVDYVGLTATVTAHGQMRERRESRSENSLRVHCTLCLMLTSRACRLSNVKLLFTACIPHLAMYLQNPHPFLFSPQDSSNTCTICFTSPISLAISFSTAVCCCIATIKSIKTSGLCSSRGFEKRKKKSSRTCGVILGRGYLRLRRYVRKDIGDSLVPIMENFP